MGWWPSPPDQPEDEAFIHRDGRPRPEALELPLHSLKPAQACCLPGDERTPSGVRRAGTITPVSPQARHPFQRMKTVVVPGGYATKSPPPMQLRIDLSGGEVHCGNVGGRRRAPAGVGVGGPLPRRGAVLEPAATLRRAAATQVVAGDRLGTVRVGRLSPVMLGAAMDRWRDAGASAATVRAARDVVRFAVSWARGPAVAGGRRAGGCGRGAGVRTAETGTGIGRTRGRDAAREDVRRAEERYVRCGGSSAAELGLFRAEQRLVLVYLVADTGLRCGELTGLRSDDLLGRELWIERAVKRDPRGGLVVGLIQAPAWPVDRLDCHGPLLARARSCLAQPSPRPYAAKCVAVQGKPTGRAAHFNRRAGGPV